MQSPNFLSVDVKEHIILMPSYIGKLEKAILDLLNSRLLQYSSELGGVMVTYFKPVILQKTGAIINDLPHIHFDLSYSTCVLQVPFNSPINVTVTRVGDDYLTCTYQGCVNIFVPAICAISNDLSEGSTTQIVIVKQGTVDKKHHVLIGELSHQEPTISTSNYSPYMSHSIEASHNKAIITEIPNKTKKRKRNHNSSCSDELSSNKEETIQFEKKKHKKKRKTDLERDEVSSSKINHQSSNLTGLEKVKHHKKKKKKE